MSAQQSARSKYDRNDKMINESPELAQESIESIVNFGANDTDLAQN